MVFVGGIGIGVLGGFLLGIALATWAFRSYDRVVTNAVQKMTDAVAHPGRMDVVPDAVSVAELLLQDTMQDVERVPDWMQDDEEADA